MSSKYVQQRSLEALGLTRNEFGENDWGEASRLLAEWAREDKALLLALAEPYLIGAAAGQIQHTARTVGKVSTSVPRPGKSPLVKAPQDGMWDVIAQHMQAGVETPANPAAHKQAVRTLAKAFAAQRLDARVAARPNK